LAVQIIEARLPKTLLYRAYVAFRQYKFGFEEAEMRIMVDLKDTQFPIVHLRRQRPFPAFEEDHR
jgi:hypothetical protein